MLAVVFLLSFGCSDDDSTTRPDTETVSTPAFNPPGGSYDSVVFVKITCATGDAERYYTLEGSDPDKSASQLAAGDSIEVDNTTIIRARAYKDGMDPSAIAEANYDQVGGFAAPFIMISVMRKFPWKTPRVEEIFLCRLQT